MWSAVAGAGRLGPVMRRIALVLACFALVACGQKASEVADSVDRGPGPSDPLGAALHRVVVARMGRLEEIGRERRGQLGAGLAEEALVLHGGYCYVLVAQAEPSAGELSLRLLDNRNEPIHVDRERGSMASLGLDEQLCTETPMSVRLELGSTGRGAYALRIFRATAM